MSASPDPELERLVRRYGIAEQEVRTAEGSGQYGAFTAARAQAEMTLAALLDHIAAHYVRRDDPRYRILDRANERLVGYTAARGILPWKPGDELPEERIRRMRDGG